MLWEAGLNRDKDRKTIELDLCGPWKYPRGLIEKEKERKRKFGDSLLRSSLSPNPSTQVANGHGPKDPPPQTIHSYLRLETTEFLPILNSAFGSGAPKSHQHVGNMTPGLEREALPQS